MNNNVDIMIKEHYRLLSSYKNRIRVLKSTPEVKEFLRMQEKFTTLYEQVKILEEQRNLELQEVSRK